MTLQNLPTFQFEIIYLSNTLCNLTQHEHYRKNISAELIDILLTSMENTQDLALAISCLQCLVNISDVETVRAAHFSYLV